MDGDFEDVYDGEKHYIKLTLNNNKDKADLLVTNRKGLKEIHPFNVKPKNDDYLLYYGKEEVKKMEEKGIF